MVERVCVCRPQSLHLLAYKFQPPYLDLLLCSLLRYTSLPLETLHFPNLSYSSLVWLASSFNICLCVHVFCGYLGSAICSMISPETTSLSTFIKQDCTKIFPSHLYTNSLVLKLGWFLSLSKQVLLILQMHVDIHTFPLIYIWSTCQSPIVTQPWSILMGKNSSLLMAAIARVNVKATFSSTATSACCRVGCRSASFALSLQNAGAKLGGVCI